MIFFVGGSSIFLIVDDVYIKCRDIFFIMQTFLYTNLSGLKAQNIGWTISKANFEVFERKTEQIFFCVSALALWNWSNKNKKAIYYELLDDKQSLISMIISNYFYDLTHFTG